MILKKIFWIYLLLNLPMKTVHEKYSLPLNEMPFDVEEAAKINLRRRKNCLFNT